MFLLQKIFNRYVLVSLALGGLIALLFYRLTGYPFVNIDDPMYISMNMRVQRGMSWESIKWAFTTYYYGNYCPLTWLAHMLDDELFGKWAGGHHLSSIVLHGLNTLLLFLFLSQATRRFWLSAIVAALFAIHPVNVEPVAWAASKKDVLSGFFWMISLHLYLRYVRRPSIARWALTFFSFCLGLMAKSVLVSLPVVMLLLDIWPLRRFPLQQPSFRSAIRLAAEKLPFFILAGVFIFLTATLQADLGATANWAPMTLAARLGNAAYYLFSYLERQIIPLRVGFPYPVIFPGNYYRIACLALVLLLTALFLSRLKSKPYLTVGWFWFGAVIAPYLQIQPIGLQVMADRWAYLPGIGLFILTVWFLESFLESLKVQVFIRASAAGVCLTALGLLTWKQVETWQSSVSLLKHAISVSNQNFVAHSYLTRALFQQKKPAEALEEAQNAYRIKKLAMTFKTLAAALESTGQSERLVDYLHLSPSSAGVYSLIESGYILSTLSHIPRARKAYQERYGHDPIDKSIIYLEQAVALDPTNAAARGHLGNAYALKKELNKALEQFLTAQKLTPRQSAVYTNLGNLYVMQERFDEALQVLNRGVRYGAGSIEPYMYVVTALVQKHRLDEAMVFVENALEAVPDSSWAWNLKGTILLMQQKPADALTCFRTALDYNQESVSAYNGIGVALLFHNKDIEGAIDAFKRALSIDPNNTQAHINMASALIAKELYNEAKKHLKEVLKLDPVNEPAKKMLNSFKE